MLNNCFRKKQKLSFKNETAREIHDKSEPMFSDNQQTDTGKTIMNRELSHVIENALQQVPFDYRIVFSLRELNGLNTQETADVLNISEANVKIRLNRAKAMLRKEVEQIYSAEEIFEFNLIYCDAVVNNVMSRIRELEK